MCVSTQTVPELTDGQITLSFTQNCQILVYTPLSSNVLKFVKYSRRHSRKNEINFTPASKVGKPTFVPHREGERKQLDSGSSPE